LSIDLNIMDYYCDTNTVVNETTSRSDGNRDTRF